MKLLGSPASPYARKLRLLAFEMGFNLPFETVAPLDDPADLLAANPLGKVPALVLDDGEAIIDSPLIAAFLLAMMPGTGLLAPDGPAHWHGRNTEAIVDGLLDAAIVLRFNAAQGVTAGDWIDRQHRAIHRALAALATRIGSGLGYPELCIITAVEYLDFRFPEIVWRTAHPALAALQARHAKRPSVVMTRPR